MTDLVDLAYTPAERKEEAQDMSTRPSVADVPKYPYGLRITLNYESLKKLGMLDDMPDIGEECHIEAIAQVVSISQRAEDPEDSANVDLQICRMGLVEDEPAGAPEVQEPDKPRRTVASYYGG